MLYSVLRAFEPSAAFPLFVSANLRPVIALNINPTIWSEDTITVMKQLRISLFQVSTDLYNQQTYYDDYINCIVPTPSLQYLNGTQKCPNANQLVAQSYDAITSNFLTLAQIMFLVYFRLPDTASHPLASFSDFAHYYDDLLIEMNVVVNSPGSTYTNAINNLGYALGLTDLATQFFFEQGLYETPAGFEYGPTCKDLEASRPPKLCFLFLRTGSTGHI